MKRADVIAISRLSDELKKQTGRRARLVQQVTGVPSFFFQKDHHAQHLLHEHQEEERAQRARYIKRR